MSVAAVVLQRNMFYYFIHFKIGDQTRALPISTTIAKVSPPFAITPSLSTRQTLSVNNSVTPRPHQTQSRPIRIHPNADSFLALGNAPL